MTKPQINEATEAAELAVLGMITTLHVGGAGCCFRDSLDWHLYHVRTDAIETVLARLLAAGRVRFSEKHGRATVELVEAR